MCWRRMMIQTFISFQYQRQGKLHLINMTNSTNKTLKYIFYDNSLNSSYVKTIYQDDKAVDEISLAGGTYYLAVTQNQIGEGVGSYNFNITYTKAVAKKATALLGKPTIKSVKKRAGKMMTVKWKKVSGAKGYELQYSRDKNFKKGVSKYTIYSSAQTSASYYNLKKKKTYYVRLRAYTEDSENKKKYSKWSAKKSVKIKK